MTVAYHKNPHTRQPLTFLGTLALAAFMTAQVDAQALPDHSVRFDAENALCRVTFQPDARTGDIQPDLELSVNMISERFSIGLHGGPHAEQAFLWGSTRMQLNALLDLPLPTLKEEPLWKGMVAAAAENAPLYFTVRDSLGSYASVRYDRLPPEQIIRTVALACDVSWPDLKSATEIEARRAERRLALSPTDILHIRRILTARYGEPGVEAGSAPQFTVTDRRYIGRYNADNGEVPLEFLGAAGAARLLAEKASTEVPVQTPPPGGSLETFRDWTLVSEESGASCAISTPAKADTSSAGSVRPQMRFSVERTGRGGLMAIDLSRPNPFAPGTPIRAVVSGQAIPLLVEPKTGALVPKPEPDGKLSNAFTVLLRQGDGAVIEGTSRESGAPLVLSYSGLGFTAAFRGMAQRCNRPGILGWIE